jgi:hypothetical protein
MEWKQGSIAEMLESETQMVLRGQEHYGEHYDLACTVTILMSTALKWVDQDRWVFASFMSAVKKHHLLALFSTLRLHGRVDGDHSRVGKDGVIGKGGE